MERSFSVRPVADRISGAERPDRPHATADRVVAPRRCAGRRAARPAARLAAVLLSWTFLLGTIATAGAAEPAARPVEFNRDVRPILSDACFSCHGPGEQKAGLRLDRRDVTLRPLESGATPIVPGKSADSELVRRILATDADEQMPPPSTKKHLTAEQRAVLRRWIDEGAEYQGHWSFEPPVRRAPPAVTVDSLPVRKPIDAFLFSRLASEGLRPAPEAERETLIRRVAFAVTGLPPTLDEVDAYLADESADAYEKMVDRYLASDRFGEEAARHWLDVARYADTHGLHLDNERQMWAYRDYVIRSFNQNKPFDQFTIEQLAGDLLPNPTVEQLVATGFNRCNVTTGEGGSIDSEWVFRNAVDRTTTMAETWLGLTAGCAVCHDHKFDPLSARDYYSLYAFFHSAADPPLDGNALLTPPTARLQTPETERRLAEIDAALTEAQRKLAAEAAALPYVDPATVQPPPPASDFESIWFDDAFPAGSKTIASPGHPTTFVTAADGQVRRGEKALRRSDKGLAQDVCDNCPPLEIPPSGKLFAHVWIDPNDRPKTLMLQYFKGGWLHRAVWGDYGAIDWGKPNSTERVLVGELPAAGGWARLEVEAARLGLQAGDQVTGFALTQFGGTVYWDLVGAAGRSDPASDPRRSLLAYWKQQTGKPTPGAPADVAAALQAGPDKKPAADVEKRLRDFFLQTVCLDTRGRLEPFAKQVAALQQEREQVDKNVPSSFIFRDLAQPRESFIMLRGQYDKPGERVEPGVPAVLPPIARPADGRRLNRLDLARWLVGPDQPLVARVTVNRFWQQIFGTGLVKTSFDFGSQGEPPSHPELLDYLAVSFREGGWNVKALLREMLTSAAFRQSSATTPELLRRDPENRLYARGPRFRLDAEQVRDNALFVSGLLNPATGGRGVNPYQPANIWEPVGFVGSNTANYRQDSGPALYRRSIYVFFKRTAPPPFMSNFDAPNRESFCSRRERSNTPLQALQLMNDVQHYEAARALAERMLVHGGATPAERIAYGWRLVLARRPAADELDVAAELLAKQTAKYRANPEAAAKAIRNGESPPRAGLDEPELAAYTLVANLLLNLDETIVRN